MFYCVNCSFFQLVLLYCYITALLLYESLSPVFILRRSFYSNSNCHTHAVSAHLSLSHTHINVWTHIFLLITLSKGLGVWELWCVRLYRSYIAAQEMWPIRGGAAVVPNLKELGGEAVRWGVTAEGQRRLIAWAAFSNLKPYKVKFVFFKSSRVILENTTGAERLSGLSLRRNYLFFCLPTLHQD